MFRSKPPRHAAAAATSTATAPQSDPAPVATSPTTPASSSSASATPTSAQGRVHRLRAPWRRAKTAADLNPAADAPAPQRGGEQTPPSRASLSASNPPDRKRGRGDRERNRRSDRKHGSSAAAKSTTAPASAPTTDTQSYYDEPSTAAAATDNATRPPCDFADPEDDDQLLPAAPALDLGAQPVSLTSFLSLSSPASPPGDAPAASRSQVSTPPPTTPSSRPSSSIGHGLTGGDRRTSGGGGSGSGGGGGGGGADTASDDSFAIAGAKPPAPPRGRALKRFSAMFKENDGRHEENLKSMKRRVVQVRRQPDHAPIRFQMGFRSRTGWEPIRAAKENQDCLIALVPWGPSSRFNFFAALDGHGRNGHQCAIFIAQRVVAYLRRMLQPLATRQAVANTLHRAIVYAERKLESVPDLDFSLSGSTGVFVLIHGCTLHCANVGDSRAVVGREEDKLRLRKQALANGGGKRGSSRAGGGAHAGGHGNPLMGRYHPVPVSFDQKPARADEKARLLKAGARVDAWESVDVGDERVWLPTARMPGLAVSRSFGDTMLKPYGVNATPELYALELCADDRFLVMASDGVFEFISSEEAIEVVGRWRDRGSAQDAAEELVKIATDRWIDDDSVIDDISCVIVFMNVVAPEVTSPEQPYLMQTSVGRADGSGSERGSMDDAPRLSSSGFSSGSADAARADAKAAPSSGDAGADDDAATDRDSSRGEDGGSAGMETADSLSSRSVSRSASQSRSVGTIGTDGAPVGDADAEPRSERAGSDGRDAKSSRQASGSTDEDGVGSRLLDEMTLVSLEEERKTNV